MATSSTIPATSPVHDAASPAPGLLISLSLMSPDALEQILANIAAAFPGHLVDVVTPDPAPPGSPSENIRIFGYTSSIAAPGTWVLPASDYIHTFRQMKDRSATSCLLLGPEAQSLVPPALYALADAVTVREADLVTARYSLGPHDGLVNSAILYPVTRALFGTRNRYPLAIDIALSSRMAERIAVAAQRLPAADQGSALMWPVAEAAAAGFILAEVAVGSRALPPPDTADLNTLIAQVAGPFFADIDAKASFWQRNRMAHPRPTATSDSAGAPDARSAGTSEPASIPDIHPMLESFRLAYTNLHEIWSLVLPPNSLLGLKKLSLMPPADFCMSDMLWARIVYDFVLAYRLRTINRGHLLGALTPLYLAWVASHLLLTSGVSSDAIAPERHVEALATAFEADKPYLVARWRWPDRFNP